VHLVAVSTDVFCHGLHAVEFGIGGDTEKVTLPVGKPPQEGVEKGPLVARAMTADGFCDFDEGGWDFELAGDFGEWSGI
tara:strand:- start:7026 stop:7262 length:237 start_codon:yes stop_codon:yes gene_type:complete